MDMETYLGHTKQNLGHLAPDTEVHVVLGNESCDLDSAVAAIVLAKYLSEINKDSPVLYVPLLNIPKEDYRLRTEITYWFEKCNVPGDFLTFQNDLDLEKLFQEGKLKLTLVDHNVLSEGTSGLISAVKDIVDHHKQESQPTDSCTVQVEPVGSCCTLVAERLLNDSAYTVEEQTAQLLYGTILLDTVCLSDAAGRKTEKDESIVAKLETLLSEHDRRQVFEQLENAKFDLSGLTIAELLRKDVKFVSSDQVKIAFCSVTLDLRGILQRDHLEQELQAFANRNGTDVVVLTCLYTKDGTPARQIAVYSTNTDYKQKITDVLQASVDPCLQLTLFETNIANITAFNQGFVTASRKAILPVVKTYLAENPKLVEVQGERLTDSQLYSTFEASDFSLLDSSATEDKSIFGVPKEQHLTNSQLYSTFEVSDSSLLDMSSTSVGESVEKPVLPSEGVAMELSSDSLIDVESPETNSKLTPSEGNPFSMEPEQNVLDSNLNPNLDPFGLFENKSSNNQSSEVAQQDSNIIDNLIDTGSTTDTGQAGGSSANDIFDPFYVPPSTESESKQAADPFSFLVQTDSPMEISPNQDGSSGEQSATGGSNTPGTQNGSDSKGSSYPLTPQNSFVDSNFDVFAKTLPSFNSSEMMAKIIEKKASLEDVPELELATNEAGKYPFTPQNSFVQDNAFHGYAQSHDLPSFHNAEMVERILEKKASLEGDQVQDDTDFEIDFSKPDKQAPIDGTDDGPSKQDVKKYPFTPQNSVQDGMFDKYAKAHNLGGFQQGDLMEQIMEKRASLGGIEDDDEIAELRMDPSIAPNSGLDTDIIEERQTNLSLPNIDAHEEHDYNVEIVERNINQWETPSGTSGNAVSLRIAEEMKIDSKGANSTTNQQQGDDVHDVAFKIANQIIERALESYQVPVEEILMSESYSDKSKRESALDELDRVETTVQVKARLSVAQEQQDADAGEETWLEDTTQEESDLAEMVKGVMMGKYAGATKGEDKDKEGVDEDSEESSGTVTPSEGTPVETEYLPEVDPLHGNLNLVPNPVKDFATDAERDVAESTSFNQVKAEEEEFDQYSGDEDDDSEGDGDAFTEEVSSNPFLTGAQELPIEKKESSDTGVDSDQIEDNIVKEEPDVVKTDPNPFDTDVNVTENEGLAKNEDNKEQSITNPFLDTSSEDQSVIDTKSELKSDLFESSSNPFTAETPPVDALTSNPNLIVDKTETEIPESETEQIVYGIDTHIPENLGEETSQTLIEDVTVPSVVDEQHAERVADIIAADTVDMTHMPHEGFSDDDGEHASSSGVYDIHNASQEQQAPVEACKKGKDEGDEEESDESASESTTEDSYRVNESSTSSPFHTMYQITQIDEREEPEGAIAGGVETPAMMPDGEAGEKFESNGEDFVFVEKPDEMPGINDEIESPKGSSPPMGDGADSDRTKSNENEIRHDIHSKTDCAQNLVLSEVEKESNSEVPEKTVDMTGIVEVWVDKKEPREETQNTQKGNAEDDIEDDVENVENKSDELSTDNVDPLSSTPNKKSDSQDKDDDLQFRQDARESLPAVSPVAEASTNKKQVYNTTAGRISIDPDTPVSSHRGSAVSQYSQHGRESVHGEEESAVLQEQMERAKQAIARADRVIADVNKRIDDVLEGNEEILDSIDSDAENELSDLKVRGDSITSSEVEVQMRKMAEDGLPEDIAMATGLSPAASDENVDKASRPDSLSKGGAVPKKKIEVSMRILGDESRSGSEDDLLASVEGQKTPEDLNTPDITLGELEWENELPIERRRPEPIPEYTAEEEMEENRHWRTVNIADKKYKIDMKVIEPYKKVLSHGGYYGDGFNAIVVFAACYLPDRGRKDYQYVMDNLFLYVISTLELLVADDYMIIYFHGATPRNRMPSLGWLKKCYQMIDRRLRKNLKRLLLVHPTLWLKTVFFMAKPFISSKFKSKVEFVKSIADLSHTVPMEYIYIPDQIKMYDLAHYPQLAMPSGNTG